MTAPHDRPHHHGNLRAALIEAGTAILDEGGITALTLRACAARAGVSHAAPAHHFQGLPGLLTAIAAEGHRRFAATMLRHRAQSDPDDRARLLAICDGYLDFARTHPGMFALMFSSPFDPVDADDLKLAAAASYNVLAEGCAPFVAPDARPEVTEIAVWSMVHGFAQLSSRARVAMPAHIGTPVDFADVFHALALSRP
jgi:AcrR family transcriptional regulator